MQGYLNGLERNGITYNPAWVCNSAFTGLGGYNAFSRIWHSGEEKPTAVICASTTIASGALRYMCENGIAVPDDMSILCNSDSMLAEFAIPQLTSIGRDKDEIARCAFSLLIERVNDTTLPVRAVRVSDKIIERHSVKRIH